MRKYGQGNNSQGHTAHELVEYVKKEIKELEKFYSIGTAEYRYMKAMYEIAARCVELDHHE